MGMNYLKQVLKRDMYLIEKLNHGKRSVAVYKL